MKWSDWPGYRAGHRWSRIVTAHGTGEEQLDAFSRPLGLLESGFDVGGQRQGQSDIHALLKVDLHPSEAIEGGADRQQDWSDRFIERLLLAWTTVRGRHPLLASRVRDGGAACNPGGVNPREFVYVPPTSFEAAILAAQDTVLLHETGPSESLDEACLAILDRYILNGERVLLDQSECLARLVLIRNPAEPLKLGLALVVAHVACDALSAFRVLRELFDEVVAMPIDASAPSSGGTTLYRLDELLSVPTPPLPAPPRLPDPPPRLEALCLPLASEEHYPIVPTRSDRDGQQLPSPARRRWFWAFKRVVLLRRQERYPRTLPFPRISLGGDAPTPPQPKTRWPRLRFDPATSARLFAICRQEGISPSMLLYAMTSMALVRILTAAHPSEPYHPIVLGFPFSSRPFCDRQPTRYVADESLLGFSDPLVDVALRITFSQIHLPAVPLDPRASEHRRQIRWQALQSARLAKRQFARMLEPDPLTRDLLHAEAYGRILDRVLSMGGDNPIPYKRIPTSLNASMIGDVDRTFPSTYTFPPRPGNRTTESATQAGRTTTPCSLQLHDLRFGTRLHRGEGMLMEAYTWQGMLTVFLGVDDELIRPEDVDALLAGIREIGHLVASPN